MNAIEIKNLTKVYKLYPSPKDRLKEILSGKKRHRDFTALNDVSFNVEKGQTVGIIGRNGSGKSTLLKIICSVLRPTSGSVKVNGRISSLLELGAGFNPEFTGRENVYMNGALMGLSRKEMDRRLPDIESFADIGEFIERPVKTYSSGMQVRLAFAAAINVDPDIFVVDEALSVGDMVFKAKCMARMQRLFESNVTILFVTHDMGSIKALCSKCLYLNSGSTVAFGPSAEVADLYLKNGREEINKSMANQKEDAALRKQLDKITRLLEAPSIEGTADRKKYNENHNFMKRVEQFRYGSGEARITNVELLNTNEEFIDEVEFDQEVILRIHVYFHHEEELSVAYQVRDSHFIGILASNIMLETGRLLNGKPGDRFVIDFRTKLPLTDGDYSILVSMGKRTTPDIPARFMDCVENAIVFRVLKRRPAKVWAKVYIENQMEIWKEP